MVCFGQAHAVRSANLSLTCPGANGCCGRASREWAIFKFNGQTHDGPVEQKIRLPCRSEDNKKCHPLLYFSNKSRVYRESHALLSISTSHPDDNRGTLTYVAELCKDHSDNSPSDVDQLERIGRTLSPFVIPKIDKSSQAHDAYANPLCASIEQLEGSDESHLRRFIHGISTGNQFAAIQRRSKRERRSLFQREFNSSYVATETIKATKGGGHRSSVLKKCFVRSLDCVERSRQHHTVPEQARSLQKQIVHQHFRG